MAMTLDGKVLRPDGGWHGLPSANDRSRLDRYRWQAQAVIVGKNSVIADDPVVVPQNPPADRDAAPPQPVMITRSSLPPADRQMFAPEQSGASGVRPLLLSSRAVPELSALPADIALGSESVAAELPGATANLKQLAARTELRVLQPEQLQPEGVLKKLSQRGVSRVLLEGGPTVNHAFFGRDLVDVLYLTLVPFLMGQSDLPGIVQGAKPFGGFDERRWKLDWCEKVDQEVFFAYVRTR